MPLTYFRIIVVEFGYEFRRFDVVHVVVRGPEAGHDARFLAVDKVDAGWNTFVFVNKSWQD